MTSYFTTSFVAVFLPVTFLAYLLVPRRARGPLLLFSSYAFLFILSKSAIAYLLASTVITYLTGMAMRSQLAARNERLKEKGNKRLLVKRSCAARMKVLLVLGLLANLAMLVALRYLRFFGDIVASLLGLVGVHWAFDPPFLGAAIGISFYTLMALSYLIDVYREKMPADTNPLRVALYLSFFPQIMEGPISRYDQTARTLWEGRDVEWDEVYAGVTRITWGFAKKIIVADRLDILVGKVFDNYQAYDGGIIACAAVMYTLQLYCDFSGCMDVALGMGRLFGVALPENFRQPFFSQTASEFWQRWHITLGLWLKDYIYYPIALSKPFKRLTSKARKLFGRRYGPLLTSGCALFVVWLVNGLWHGAGSQYLFFGMYYFVIILVGGFVEPVARDLAAQLGINRESVSYRCMRVVRTLVIIFIGEMFFRANGMTAGLEMFTRLMTAFSLQGFKGATLLSLGLDLADYSIVSASLLMVTACDVLKECGHSPLAWLVARREPLRWGIWLLLFLSVVVFGAYGIGYVPVDPMYAQF